MESFAPIIGRVPRVLILGSMPSQKSLVANQYYGHPQNSFWWIMTNILGFSQDLSYLEKTKKLERSSVAVWDVLKECQRKGSLDSNIVRSSEIPNDISSFVECHPTIELLVFNGGAAKAIFKRHHPLLLEIFETVQLPSTSPAYASISRDKKYQAWYQAIQPYLNR